VTFSHKQKDKDAQIGRFFEESKNYAKNEFFLLFFLIKMILRRFNICRTKVSEELNNLLAIVRVLK